MPWEKDFDEDDVLQRAMRVFWSKGYEATSMSDLTKAMKINKGSLYNAFGNKKALFAKTILKYRFENHRAALRLIEAIDDPIEAIGALFDGLIAESAADTERKGCLLVNTAVELPHHDPDIQDAIRTALEELESCLAGLIRRAQESEQAPRTLDPQLTARSLLSQVVGLRVLARGVYSADGLRAIRDQALNQLAA